MKKLLCKIGMHDYERAGLHGSVLGGVFPIDRCKRCGLVRVTTVVMDSMRRDYFPSLDHYVEHWKKI